MFRIELYRDVINVDEPSDDGFERFQVGSRLKARLYFSVRVPAALVTWWFK